MPISVDGKREDTVKDACEHLRISRNTLLDYIKTGIVDAPPTTKRGKTSFRYFTEDWYLRNKPKVEAL
jgi:predicted site-specific integrase-resolvase